MAGMNQTQKKFFVARSLSNNGLWPGVLRRSAVNLGMLAACLVMFSCSKLEPVNTVQAGELKLDVTKFTDAIPDEYGPVIGVTQNAENPAWITLWFQKPDKAITAVFVNINQGRIYDKTLSIPRK